MTTPDAPRYTIERAEKPPGRMIFIAALGVSILFGVVPVLYLGVTRREWSSLMWLFAMLAVIPPVVGWKLRQIKQREAKRAQMRAQMRSTSHLNQIRGR